MEALAIEHKKDTVYSIDEQMEALYKNVFPKFAAFIARHHGDLEDARDIFHDAMLRYLESGARAGIDNESAYLMTIARNLWFGKIKENKKQPGVTTTELIIEEINPDKKLHQLYNFLAMTGGKCMDLLTSFYFEQKSIRDIKEQFNFSSEHSTSAQKYKCVEKLRKAIKEKSLNYEDFV